MECQEKESSAARVWKSAGASITFRIIDDPGAFVHLQKLLFRFRSYTPLPFLLVMVIFARPSAASMAAGFALALCGELLRAWGVAFAGSETRTTSGVGASKLVTAGPFALVRNPLYIGNILLYTGIGVMSWALFPWLQLAALGWFIFQYTLIVREEEAFLCEAFGEEYRRYCARVHRFLPRFRPAAEGPSPAPDWRAGWRSEYRTLQAFLIVLLLLVIRWRII